MLKIILSILLSFGPSKHDTETAEERAARIKVIAESIEIAADGDQEVAAFLLMTGLFETRFARHVHEGRCKPEECDGGKARTVWQVWRLKSMSAEQWHGMLGSDLESTTNAAKYAARLFIMKRNYCRSTIGAINAYASGKCYKVKDFDPYERQQTMRDLLKRMK